MSENGSGKPERVSVKEAHAERVARAMRENLRKRRAQAREREAGVVDGARRRDEPEG